MKISLLFIFCFFILLTSCSLLSIQKNATIVKDSVPPIDKSLALKPPMGWNSWDCLGWAATEADVRGNTDFMAKNLKSLGYEYVVIDMLWYGDEKAISFEDFVHETMSVKPNYNIDSFGRLLPDTSRFPSAKNGKGFKPLAAYIHSLGLKMGVHVLRGIPWQAADRNMTIKGTNIKASTIAQKDKGCDWYDGFYGVDMAKPGAQEYYNSVFQLLGEWDIDFVKVDDITNVPELEGISKGIRSSGRKMLISIVPDDLPMDTLKANAHMSRTGSDFWDVWEMLKKGFPVAAKAVKNVEPGFWPDLDMLPVGKIGKHISYKGPNERISNLSKDELHSLLTLWYISRAPLMLGSYLPETDPYTLELLTNKEALEVNRNSTNNRKIKFKNAVIIWSADIPGSDDKYVAFFNQWESKNPVDIKLDFTAIGLKPGEYKVRDLWAKKDAGTFNNTFSNPVEAHAARLYRVSKN